MIRQDSANSVRDFSHLQDKIRAKTHGRVENLRLLLSDEGLILRGRTRTYHIKQLAQQAVLETLDMTIVANEIEVG